MTSSHNQHLVVAPCPLYLTSVWLSARRSCTEKSPLWKLSQACWIISLQWRHNESDGVSNHRRIDFFSTVCSGADQMKLQSPGSLAFVMGIHRWPVNFSHKGPVTQNCFHSMTSNVQNWQKIYLLFGWFKYNFIFMNVYIQLTITHNYR